MNTIRPEENALLIWNRALSHTAYISGEELKSLVEWANGTENGFSKRLKRLGLINDADKLAIVDASAAAVHKKAPLRSFCAPESLHIELTEQCPLSCPQCYKSASHSQAKEIPFDRLLGVLQQANAVRVFQIALGGGEPLVYPYLLPSIHKINTYGMASSITTSGFGLDKNVLDELIHAGLDHIQISLNGSCEEVHSLSRDGYSLALNALELLKTSEISYGINWVARKDNIDDFPMLLEKISDFRAHNINILRYKPSSEVYSDNYLSPEKMLLLAKLIRNSRGMNIKTDSAFSNLRCHINSATSFLSGCGAGRRFLAVDAEGFCRPCSHVNMREDFGSIEYVWNNSANLDKFRNICDNISEPCIDCAYLHGCYGCRAIALVQGKGFYSGEGDCIFYSASG